MVSGMSPCRTARPHCSSMAYAEHNLLSDERLIYATRLHKYVFVKPAIVAAAFLLVVVFADGGMPFLMLASFVGLFSLYPMADYLCSEFAVTNRRLLIRSGIIHRKKIHIPLAELADLRVKQGVFGRALNLGYISVELARDVDGEQGLSARLVRDAKTTLQSMTGRKLEFFCVELRPSCVRTPSSSVVSTLLERDNTARSMTRQSCEDRLV